MKETYVTRAPKSTVKMIDVLSVLAELVVGTAEAIFSQVRYIIES